MGAFRTDFTRKQDHPKSNSKVYTVGGDFTIVKLNSIPKIRQTDRQTIKARPQKTRMNNTCNSKINLTQSITTRVLVVSSIATEKIIQWYIDWHETMNLKRGNMQEEYH